MYYINIIEVKGVTRNDTVSDLDFYGFTTHVDEASST
jgi:hypothetical protein